MLVNSSNGSTAQNASHLDDHPEIEKPRDYFPISIPHRDSGDEVSKFGRMREHMKSYTPVHPNENRGIDYYSKDKPSRQAVYSSPECKTLQLKPKYIESEVASKLMKMCPVFKNQFKYHKGERLYLPEYTIKLMGEGNTKRNRLMIVCHPDDEIIFGGDELLRYPGEWVIVYITNDHKRIKGVKKVMHAINANESIIYGLADSMRDEFRYPIAFVVELYELICSQHWAQIVTHGETGEYGHRAHIALHQIVFHLLAKAGVSKMSGTQITTMKLNRSQPRSANKSFIEQRQQLCKTMYYRSSRKWMRMIEKATTVSFDPTKEQIDYDIDHLLCQ
eukprot:CFRG1759T1